MLARLRKSMCLLISLASMSSLHAEPVLHRAVEPAQILLDITLKEKNLTLFLTIPTTSASLLTPEDDIASLLTRSANLWRTDPKAECTLNNHRIFQNQQNNDEQPLPDVQGFYDFECRNPQSLFSIRPDLHSTLPGLKQLNVWVTTDHWQNKQSLKVPESATIMIQPGS